MAQSVLIVDDHAPFRARARTVLEDDGFRVVGEAADGEEAVAAAQRLRPEMCCSSSAARPRRVRGGRAPGGQPDPPAVV